MGTDKQLCSFLVYLKAKILDKKNEKEKALVNITSALSKIPDNPGWINLKARLLMETNQFDQGIQLLKRAVELDPQQASLWEEIGDTFYNATNYESAAVAYDNCFAALPDRLNVLNKFGNCCLELKQFGMAGKAYRMVLVKDSNNKKAKEGLGKIAKQRC